ncbi:MAG: hypothetical protein WBC97_08260 [Gemmatimonadales bacterium]
MSVDDRLRPHPHDRLAAATQLVDLKAAANGLRQEPHAAVEGHRQITLARQGSVATVLFIFNAGAELKAHRANGVVTIQTLAGELRITADGAEHSLPASTMLTLAAGVTHDVHAVRESEMLLTVTKA